ncbi:MAG: type VI secretion system ATPase TssH [Hyphomicrobiales bacterium]|nr:type VI secretion system ATPase TssH [Hyphomicrobiales bacterium]
MGADISVESVAGKLNRLGYEAFILALRQAKTAGNRNIELGHWMFQLLQKDRTDIALTADHYKLNRARLLADAGAVVNGFRKNETEMPGISNQVADALDRGWHYATLLFGETQIRTGHLLVAMLKSIELRRALIGVSQEFAKIPVDEVAVGHRSVWEGSDEGNLRPMDGSGVAAASAEGTTAAPGAKGTTALDRFSQDLTAKAKAGAMDPILGRDEEIRQIVDVLMRRRQNNPILTGEAGVGKTAVVEGFAQRIASGDVPPPLRGVKLCVLDVGLMQAGASMKGEFEQRLRSVIDEVQSSPTPIILFIDEAHTLIGAGGAAGTGDAANLLKPALARGTLRTIAATTWAEYRQYFEKDPALTRRFQPVYVGEPDAATAAVMLRGLVGPMEKHHKVRVTDEAIVAAVNFSHRYIPARQLPDKAVSLLDTACARVAISQNAKPAAVEDAEVAIASLESEKKSLERERDLGAANEERIAEIDAKLAERRSRLAALESDWSRERALVEEILGLRDRIVKQAASQRATPGSADASPPADAKETSAASEPAAADGEALRAKVGELGKIEPEKRMIYAHVDEQAVASVVSDWTGIPVGKMVADEVETVLNLADILNRRIVGQDHGLKMIAKRIETNRARLDNPNKPIGVFMLCGPSGVGKTETALALAETLYGGEQNIIAINMSEFQEAHTVSTLKGAPPGYVGYGEGGRLTEAVRRRPYSVVLLDEIEKAHPDVHEIFFQVFDKGVMEDGMGRRIDFKNTLILLTTNVGTEIIMRAAGNGAKPNPETLAQEIKPALLAVFPPALLGRIVTIPYYPLSAEMLAGIVKLQLGRIGQRIEENHRARFIADQSAIDHIVSMCSDPESGGRVIDNIITNTILPALSRDILKRSLAREEIHETRVSAADGAFVYEVN